VAGFPRGTTPKIVFTLPFPASALESVYITFSQGRAETLIKHGNQITAEGNTLTVQLTQEETLKFFDRLPIEIQIRAIDTEGSAIASKIITTDVARILQGGVIK